MDYGHIVYDHWHSFDIHILHIIIVIVTFHTLFIIVGVQQIQI